MQKYLKFLPFIVSSIGIFLASSFEKPVFEVNEFYLKDKVFHLVFYYIYGIAVQLVFLKLNIKKTALFTIIIGMTYGASDELHQYFVPGRSMEFLDWVADGLGVIFSTFTAGFYKKLFSFLK